MGFANESIEDDSSYSYSFDQKSVKSESEQDTEECDLTYEKNSMVKELAGSAKFMIPGKKKSPLMKSKELLSKRTFSFKQQPV